MSMADDSLSEKFTTPDDDSLLSVAGWRANLGFSS